MSQTDNVRFGTFCKAVGYWLLAISLLLAANREIRTPTSILPFVHICRQKVVVAVHREKIQLRIVLTRTALVGF